MFTAIRFETICFNAQYRHRLYYFGFISCLSSVFPISIYNSNVPLFQFWKPYRDCKLISSYKQRIISTRLQVCAVSSFYATTQIILGQQKCVIVLLATWGWFLYTDVNNSDMATWGKGVWGQWEDGIPVAFSVLGSRFAD